MVSKGEGIMVVDECVAVVMGLLVVWLVGAGFKPAPTSLDRIRGGLWPFRSVGRGDFGGRWVCCGGDGVVGCLVGRAGLKPAPTLFPLECGAGSGSLVSRDRCVLDRFETWRYGVA